MANGSSPSGFQEIGNRRVKNLVHENIKLESNQHLESTTNYRKYMGLTTPQGYNHQIQSVGSFKTNNLVFSNKSIASREKEPGIGRGKRHID